LNELYELLASSPLSQLNCIFWFFALRSFESETGDETDVVKWAHKLMNKSVANRTITKQEAMCELGQLPMVICSEGIETVSITGSTRCSNETSTILSQYKKRPDTQEHLSLHEFFHTKKNKRLPATRSQREIVPHYVGGSGQPVYPLTKQSISYARSEILKHMPWSQKNPMPNECDWVAIFKEFLQDPSCPAGVKLGFERAKLRYELRGKGIQEVFQPDTEHSNATDDLDDDEIGDVIALTESLGYTEDELDKMEENGFCIGRDYDWGRRVYTVSNNCIIKQTTYCNQFGNNQDC
jgi:hypothetical protein